MHPGEEVREYLKDHGISQSFISRETGISRPKLNMALTGKRKMSFEEYELICGALHVNTDYFVKPKVLKVKN
jgi:transcriptional regulator with XRE-family HTH domain